MSKNDNLLTEAQVRQFMKLANLRPLTPGFVHGLNETGAEDTGASKGDESATHKGEKDYTTKKGDELKHSGKGRGEKKGDKAYVNEADDEYEGDQHKSSTRNPSGTLKSVDFGEKDADTFHASTSGPGTSTADSLGLSGSGKKAPETALAGKKKQQESHGRGRGEGAAGHGHPDDAGRAGNRLREMEDDEAQLHDLEDAEDDLDHADDLDIDAEEDLEDAGMEIMPSEGGREVSVDDFLIALEQALENVLGDEVEVDQEEEPEEAEEEEELEIPLGGGEEMDIDMEEELPLQEMINTITKRVAKRIVREALHKNKK